MFIKEILGINELISLYPTIYTQETETVTFFFVLRVVNKEVIWMGKKHHYALEMFIMDNQWKVVWLWGIVFGTKV